VSRPVNPPPGGVPPGGDGGETASAWRSRRALVTGATGLLGSWVVAALQARGAQVVALVRDTVPGSHLWEAADRTRLVVVRAALDDLEALVRAINEYEVDTVFHLAAQTLVPVANREPLSTFESNIRGTYHVLDACRRSPSVRAVLVASSDKAYGEQDQLPYTEDAPLLARHPYDASKACADILSLTYAATYDLPVCVTRCGNLYGPGDLNWSRLVPGTIRSLLWGERPLIRSDGSLVRDYFYVEDAAEAYLRLAEHVLEGTARGEAFNFSNDEPLSVLDMVARITAAVGVEIEPEVLGHSPGEIRHQFLSSAKARARLGWQPRHSIEEGLAATVAWYRARPDLVGAPRG